MAKPRKRKKKTEAAEDLDLPDPTPRAAPDFAKYAEAAGKIDGFAPAADVLDKVTAVRTCFPDFNRATTVGGLPVRRIHTVHGPTHGGKTAFVLGLVKSFAEAGFLVGYIDAEHTLGKEFAQEAIPGLEQLPNFQAMRPDSYEKAIEASDNFMNAAHRMVQKYPEAKSLLVVDTINKLVPAREMESLFASLKAQDEAKARGATKKEIENLAKGHGGRYKASVNNAWLDRLTPQVARAECACIMIAQERGDGMSDNGYAKTTDFDIKGGQALTYDASMIIRVSKAKPIATGEGKGKKIHGFRHRVRIWKSKVGHMEGSYTDCFFHLSNGNLIAPGFGTVWDAVEVGAALGIIKKSGSWYSFNKRRKQGENGMAKYLAANEAVLVDVLTAIGNKLDQIQGRA